MKFVCSPMLANTKIQRILLGLRKKKCYTQTQSRVKSTSMNLQKHIEYWLTSAAEDWEIAQDLVNRQKNRHGLFFAHLTLEKVIKAHVCHTTKEVAPRLHTLLRLAEKANLSLSQEQRDFLAEFDRYQLEGRYPEDLMAPPTQEEAQIQLAKAREIYQWLVQQLSL